MHRGSIKNEYPLVVGKSVQITEHYNPAKRRLKVILADGSLVTIGSKGSVKYPAGFSGERRDVYLAGETFFDVKKYAIKPFIVYTGNEHTTVLGTSFKVSALRGAAGKWQW